MDLEATSAHLSIVDGAWQDSPDNLGVFEDSGRGTLYVLVEIAGEAEGRDVLARDLIETARSEYAASRGSITLALSQVVTASNSHFYNVNVNTVPEARRIGGMTAAVLRGNELFVAQGGPGLTTLLRGTDLQRLPDDSPWFEPGDAIGEFPTEGSVPLGLRREYTPDLFHIALEPGDTILLSTRSLVHLVTTEELLDTLIGRHPDEIVESLEDLAGAADLSAIAIRVEEPGTAAEIVRVPARPAEAPMEEKREPAPPPMTETYPRAAPSEEELARRRARAEQARAQRLRATAAALQVAAGAMSGLAKVFSRIDWTRMGAAADRVISGVLRALVRVLVFAVRAFLPGEPADSRSASVARPSSHQRSAWRAAALVFPVLLVLVGGAAWVNRRAEVQRSQSDLVAQLIDRANASIETGKKASPSDEAAARDAFQTAITLAQQARDLSPNNAAARDAFYQAQDLLDGLNGISVLLYVPEFAAFTYPKSDASRIVSHWPDLFVLDRGAGRIYHYVVNDVGSSAAPTAGDGMILKAGDKIGDWTVGDLFDILWIDSGQLVALDRNGAFLVYDPAKSTWTTRAASDASQWAHVTLAAGYVGNVYLLDPTRNQILKYVATAEGNWTSSVTYLAPGVNVDLSTAVDMAIDGDVWVLRADGSMWRFTAGRLVDFAAQDLDQPFSKPMSFFTSQTLVGIYVADTGNQRIVQLDKVTGKFVRQFRPRGQDRASFDALRAVAVDEANKRFFFVSANRAYLATIPQ